MLVFAILNRKWWFGVLVGQKKRLKNVTRRLWVIAMSKTFKITVFTVSFQWFTGLRAIKCTFACTWEGCGNNVWAVLEGNTVWMNFTFKDFFIKCVDPLRNDDSQCSPTQQPCSQHSDQLQLFLQKQSDQSLHSTGLPHCSNTRCPADNLITLLMHSLKATHRWTFCLSVNVVTAKVSQTTHASRKLIFIFIYIILHAIDLPLKSWPPKVLFQPHNIPPTSQETAGWSS